MDKYSPLYWNEQASGTGLTRDLIQQITGMQFNTKWNADNSVDYFWYTDVRNRAPGFAAAGLLLDPGPSMPRDVMPYVGLSDYPNWVVFKSAQGYVAPGANAPWTPALDSSFQGVQGPIAPAPSTPIGVGPTTAPAPTETVDSITAELSALAYEQFHIQDRVNQSPVCDDTRPEYDGAACQKMQDGVLLRLRAIEQRQRELQGMAAKIAQPGTPPIVTRVGGRLTVAPPIGTGGGTPASATTPAQPNAPAARTPPNVMMMLALGVVAVLAFAYFRGHD